VIRFHPGAIRRALGPALVVLALIAPGVFPRPAAAAEDLGTIVVVQSTYPEAAQDFHYTSELPEYGDFWLDDDDDATLSHVLTIPDVPAGAYTLFQDDPPIGWALIGVSCDDPDGGTNGYTNGALLDVDAGETITCTFTNSPPTGDVVIHQDTVPNDPVGFSFDGYWGDFTLADDGNELDDGTWNTISTSGVPPGTYQIVQGQTVGWRLTGISCGDPDGGTTFDLATATLTIDVDAGETIECTFTSEPVEAAPPPPSTPSCNGKVATIVAAPGTTAVRGTQGADVIVALDGNVRIDGRGGDDTICAGAGDNIVNGGAGDDWVDAGDGANTVDGGGGSDTIRAGAGNDVLLGGTGDDEVFGGDGDNLVSTGAGADDIVTGAGDDRIDGGKDFDTCQPGDGTNGVKNCEA